MKKSKKQVEREARQERENRLAYIGRLASGLAHEIRTPLNSISMNIQLLQKEAERVPKECRHEFARRLELMRKEAENLRNTLDEFLSFASPPRMNRVPTDINSFVDEILEFVEPQTRAMGVTIEQDFEKEIYPVVIDQRQFGSVVINLVANAFDALRNTSGERRIQVKTRESEDCVELRISDNGGGIDPGDEEKVFNEFYTTKERGTGLGLPIARRIVEEHGGSLTLENDPGTGAALVVRLPREKVIELARSAKEGEA